MIKTVITGTITDIFPVEHIGNFKKRNFWIKEAEGGNVYQVECYGNELNLPSNFKAGELVNCHAEIRGRRWEKNGRVGVINSIKCTGLYILKDANPLPPAPANDIIDDDAGDLPF